LIGTGHAFVEDVERDFDEAGMSDPSSVVSGVAFALLVGLDLVHDGVILGFVVLDRDLSSHSSDSGYSSPESPIVRQWTKTR
jgi:hypothetical protein